MDLIAIIEHISVKVLLVLFGLILTPIGIWIGVLAIKRKTPCWAIASKNLIHGTSKRVPKLEIKYANNNVENLTVSTIMFWNAGRETIDGSDITNHDSLKIVPKNGATILDTKIIKISEPATLFRIGDPTTPDDTDKAFLEFDYLDHRMGAQIQIIHTGVSSKDLEVTGKIKGASKIKQRKQGRFEKFRDDWFPNLFGTIFFGSPGIMFLVLLFVPPRQPLELWKHIFAGVVCIGFFVFAVFFVSTFFTIPSSIKGGEKPVK